MVLNLKLKQIFQHFKKKMFVGLMMLLVVNSMYSQEQVVKGVITDESNMPVPGVNIVIKGTTTGTITDIDGRFSLNLAGYENPVITVSYVGYVTEEVLVGSQAEINVQLVPDLLSLDEVLVVGYGTMKKKLNTGANTHVSSKDIEQKHSLRLEQALQGFAPGVNVTANNGQPGSGFKVNIRGVGTIGNAEPLYVVDGVPIGDVSYINPSDVESIDVLKDAASCAIYGARAANGVVLITTKKGNSGESHISFNSYYGVQNELKRVKMLNTKDYVMLVDEAYINSNPKYRTSPRYPKNLPFLPQLDENNNIVYDNNGNIQIDPSVFDTIQPVDWQDYMFTKNAPVQSHSLSIEGGNEKNIYSASINYFAQDGIIGTHDQSSFERMSARLNSESKIFHDIFKFGENLTFAHTQSHGVGTGNIYSNTVRSFINTSPTFQPYDNSQTDGFGKSIYPSEVNPVAGLYYTNQKIDRNNKVIGNVYLELSPIKGLRVKTDLGIDFSEGEYNGFTPVFYLSTLNSNTNSTATMNMNRYFGYNWENTITYDFSFGNHSITLLAGNTVRKQSSFYVGGSTYDLLFPEFEFAILDNGTNDSLNRTYGTKSEEQFLSYFGRVNYNYKEKILFTGVFRRDGSTKFGPDNRFGNFKSVSAGYVLTEEDFFKLSWLDFLKVRAGWGQNGNDNIPSFAYESLIDFDNRNYYFGSPESKYVGASPGKVENPAIRWETAEQTNIGFDSRFLKNFSFVFDWYQRNQKDWLVTARMPELIGILDDNSYPQINGGNIKNSGLEFALGYQNKIGDLNFSINGNIAFNKNKVTDIPTMDSIIHGRTGVITNGSEEFYRAQEGYPLAYFWGYETLGIFQDTVQINNYKKDSIIIQEKAQPGDVIFRDRNNDGRIDAQDKTMIGTPWPKCTYGLSISADYKGFDFSITLQGVSGNDIVYGYYNMDALMPNKPIEALERWHGPGTSNKFPRVTSGSEANKNWKNFSDLYIHDGSYLKVRSINIGYDFAQTLLKDKLTQCRIYFSIINAFTFTKYKGFDPEVGYGDYSYTSYENMSRGIDLGTYPQSRQYLLGVNLKF